MIPTNISSMDHSEKLHLLWELWDSLSEDESKIPVSEEDRIEMQRRLDLYRQGRLTTDSWGSVKAQILGSR